MSISEKYAIINGRSVNVYTQEQFFDNKEEILSSGNTDSYAVEVQVGDDQYILPVRTDKTSDKPGIYACSPNNPFAIISAPSTKEEKETYKPDPDNIVDFNNAKGIQDVVSMKEKLNTAMNQYLETDVDDGNTFRPPLLDTDSPEIRGLKQALIEKHIDIDKYAERFGANWPNDKRKLKSDSITMYLLKRSFDNFDLKADLVIYDSNPDVPNPMGKKITINLCPGNNLSATIEDDKRES